MFELIPQAIYSGLLSGGVYALVAIGLALTFGTLRVINLAHGELVLLAAYLAYVIESRVGFNSPAALAAIPLALLLTCLCAALMYLLLARIRRNREMNSLLLTFALGVILTNAVLLIWSGDVHSTGSLFLQDAVKIGSLVSMRSELYAFLASLALIALLWLWLAKSWLGRTIRAVSSNRVGAMLMGIDPARAELISFIIAGILAAFAGLAIYSSSVIQPSLGHALTVKAFIITVLAGIGSVPGVLAAALLLGIIEALTVTLWSSALQELAGMILFLLVLFVLPTGLMGLRQRS